MEKLVQGILLLALCAMVSCNQNIMEDGKMEGEAAYNRGIEYKMTAGTNKEFYFYIDTGRTKKINYISYQIETRKKNDGSRNGKEITVIRIVGR